MFDLFQRSEQGSPRAKRAQDVRDNRYVVAKFVSENLAGPLRTVLRVAERWENLIYGSFAVLRHGRDIYFMYYPLM